ncbi:MAG: PhnD/SsuA/transferrin family substrate-binding protein, partial [Fimbriimonadales bacterium]|nr:PhnD/SsuA/transferrin family substrate-binding protein [Fimbriimonadales bacterium]
VHIAWFAPTAYVLGNARCGAEVGLIAIRAGLPYYGSQILVRADLGAKSLADLRGKRFAVVDPASTSGYIWPMVYIKKKGYDPNTFFSQVVQAGGRQPPVACVPGQVTHFLQGVPGGGIIALLAHQVAQVVHRPGLQAAQAQLPRLSPGLLPALACPRLVTHMPGQQPLPDEQPDPSLLVADGLIQGGCLALVGQRRRIIPLEERRKCQAAYVGGLAPAIADRPMNAPAVHELRGEHASGARGLSPVVPHLVDHGEAVALAQVPVKVDIRGEDVGDLDGDRVREIRGVGRCEERAADLARGEQHAPLERGRLFLDAEILAAALDREHGVPVAVAQPEQPAVVGDAGVHGAPGHELAERGGGLAGGDERLQRFGIVRAEPREQRRDGVSPLHLLLPPVALVGGARDGLRRRPHLFDHARLCDGFVEGCRREAEGRDHAEERQEGEEGEAAQQRSHGEAIAVLR